MMTLFSGGLVGLVMGAAVQRMGLTRREGLRAAVSGASRDALRRLWLLPGGAALLAALLCWLAVIDVDLLAPLPLHAGTLLGAAVFGAAAGWTGLTPGAALAGVGGGRLTESLCAVAGCVAGGLCLTWTEPWLTRLRATTLAQGTLFRVTLDEPWLLDGGFLGLGCFGALLLTVGLCIRRGRNTGERAQAPAKDAEAPAKDAEAPAKDAEAPAKDAEAPAKDAEAPAKDAQAPAKDAEAPAKEPHNPEKSAAAPPSASPDASAGEPSAVAGEAFVAALPGEEPVVVDTAADPPDDAP